jgi:F-type H+-transporting ATPase subunit gamma
VARLLPLDVPPPRRPEGAAGEPVPPTFLPDAEAVRRRIVPEAVRARLYECFLEASVSEHVARMTAMRYASENAQDLIHELTVRYNRARQSQITMELAEIMGGREGVEGL